MGACGFVDCDQVLTFVVHAETYMHTPDFTFQEPHNMQAKTLCCAASDCCKLIRTPNHAVIPYGCIAMALEKPLSLTARRDEVASSAFHVQFCFARSDCPSISSACLLARTQQVRSRPSVRCSRKIATSYVVSLQSTSTQHFSLHRTREGPCTCTTENSHGLFTLLNRCVRACES